MDELIQRRVQRLNKLMDKGINPFSETNFEKTKYSSEIKKHFSTLAKGDETDKTEKVSGRIMSIRIHGGVAFVDLLDAKGKIQLLFRKDSHGEPFEFLQEYLDEGDFIGVSGLILKTKRGEISVKVSELKILSKSLRPLPSEWYGLKDIEKRYRQRYVDLVMNEEVRNNFKKISEFVNGMREYMLSREFVEVNTPILQPIYGGAFAQPFKTHHNFLKQDMFLRIAPELYLKRLIVGGMEKVFEFATCFRNESVDSRHNPEFVQMELYQAFTDYRGMMTLAENVISYAVKKAIGTTKINYQENEIEFAPPWRKITMSDSLKKVGIDLSKMSDEQILSLAKKEGIKAHRVGEAIEELFSLKVEKTLIQPTFITEFPSDISPLAKKVKDNPKWAQRFEIYIAGSECGNAFSELNNPLEQYSRFKEEEDLRKKLKIKGLEIMPMDKDYIRSLEYGLPPTGGMGIGISRITTILFNKPSIKEVILFPTVSGTEEIKNVAEMDGKLAKRFD